MHAFLVLCLVALATADKLGYNYQPVGHDVNVGGGYGSAGGYSGGNGGFGGALNIAPIGGGSIGGGYSGGYSGAGSIGVGSIGGGLIGGGYNGVGSIGVGSIGGGSIGGGSFGGGSIGGGSIGSGSIGGGSFGGGSIGGGSIGGGSIGGGSIGGGSIGGVLIGGGSLGGASLDAASIGAGAGAGAGASLSVAPVATEYSKEFYFHSAPEEESYDTDANQQIASTLKKNLRVIFIKAPENNGLSKAAIQLAKHAIEDKTAIYVLSKQHDISELANQLHVIKETHSQKPEVHFVKYRTHEDAVRAQQSIQDQYESLGGSSHNSNEGVAPVLNFVSQHQADAGVGSAISGGAVSHGIAGHAGSGYSIGGGQISTGSHASAKEASSYLPPIAKF